MIELSHVKLLYLVILTIISPRLVMAEEGAGTLMQKMSQKISQQTAVETKKIDIPEKKQQATVSLKGIVFEGNKKISSTELHRVIKIDPEKKYTFEELQNFCQDVENYYSNQGYTLVYAWLPTQNLSDGLLKILITEAHINKIILDNNTNLNDRLVKPLFMRKGSNETLQDDKELANVLFQINNYPGVGVHAVYSQSDVNGAADVNVVLDKKPFYNFSVNSDAKDISSPGIGARFSLNNPLGQADQFSAYAMSNGPSLVYGIIDYNLALTAYGTRLGSSASVLFYDNSKKKEFSSLGNTGRATKLSIYAKQSLYQTPKKQIVLGIESSKNILKDHYKATRTKNDRQLNSLTISLDYNLQRERNYVQSQISCTLGVLQYDDATAKALDQAGPKREGGYSLCGINVGYQYLLNSENILKFNTSAQYSPNKLDSNAQFNISGVDVGGGDSGYNVGITWMRQITQQWQGVLSLSHSFVHRRDDKSNFSINSLNLGVNWQSQNGWLLGVGFGQPFAATDNQKRKTAINVSVNKTF